MQIKTLISQRLADAIAAVSPADVDLAAMVRPTQDKSLGDFQINAAMSLAKKLKTAPRQVAQQLVDALSIADVAESTEIAGPGFINLRLRDQWICEQASAMLASETLGITPTSSPARVVIDYSSPNVAKPMHVGHIRSCFIGDALARVMRYLGHHVITDNHLGDWGTQFGMVIYGYRNFLNLAVFAEKPVPELLRVYRIVNTLIEYKQAEESLPAAQTQLATIQAEASAAARQLETAAADQVKKLKKAAAAAEKRVQAAASRLRGLHSKIEAVQQDQTLSQLVEQHSEIANAVLLETAKLHSGDRGNVELWKQLLPYCMDEINRVYDRLKIEFDYVLGESFYHSMLPGVVQQLRDAGLAKDSEGAVCLFLPEFDSPMIVQKKDGAFLYATTDLATIAYRQEAFQPDEILYVVDFRQADHFQKLFAAAKLMGFTDLQLVHVSFGTVLDQTGKPLKTRSGTLAGLTSLLDDAVGRAFEVVCDPERTQKIEPPLGDDEKKQIAECVGVGAIKYADLAHHRTSDYKFSLDKMVSLDGNTSAYVQYSYARIQGILRSAGLSEEDVIERGHAFVCPIAAERELLVSLLRLEEVLSQVREEYAPNLLVDYLYEIAKGFASMYEQCPVLKAEDDVLRNSRLAIIALAGRVLRQGLALLGIGVVSRM